MHRRLSTGLQAFLHKSSGSPLLGVPVDDSTSQEPLPSHSAVLESQHPYPAVFAKEYKVIFPEDVVFIRLDFDERCSTVQDEDFLQVLLKDDISGDVSGTSVMFDRFSGPRERWPYVSLVVPGNTATLRFQSASQYLRDKPGEDQRHARWGFRCIATGLVSAFTNGESTPPVTRLLRNALHSVLSLATDAPLAVINKYAKPGSDAPADYAAILSSGILENGLEDLQLVRSSSESVSSVMKHVTASVHSDDAASCTVKALGTNECTAGFRATFEFEITGADHLPFPGPFSCAVARSDREMMAPPQLQKVIKRLTWQEPKRHSRAISHCVARFVRNHFFFFGDSAEKYSPERDKWSVHQGGILPSGFCASAYDDGFIVISHNPPGVRYYLPSHSFASLKEPPQFPGVNCACETSRDRRFYVSGGQTTPRLFMSFLVQNSTWRFEVRGLLTDTWVL